MQGETWGAAFAGHEVNLFSAEEDRKRLMLERYQEEVREPMNGFMGFRGRRWLLGRACRLRAG